jgi:hypothetical protein
MSNTTDFMPLSPELGIAGSSYRLQMGRVNDFWAIRLVKGRDVLDSRVFKDEEDMPNGNKLTGWVLSVLVLPNINTFQIQKTVGFVRQKAMRNFEDLKQKKKSAGKSESTDVKLEKVPEGAQVKRSKPKGWVKEDKSISAEDKKKLASASPALAASNKSSTASPGTIVVTKGNRKLQPIPYGDGFKATGKIGKGEAAKGQKAEVVVKKAEKKIKKTPAKAEKAPTQDMASVLKRLDALETTVKELKAEIAGLKK